MVIKNKEFYWLGFILTFVFTLIFCVGVSQTLAQTPAETERINGFYASAHINLDASVDIKEKIIYYFGDTERHGIFRTIPIKYETSLGNQSIDISNVTVTDELLQPIPFDVSKSGKNLEIKIGDANETVTGLKTYIIGYHVERTVGYYKNFDEWYWNITGNDWNVPIGEVEVLVFLPKPIPGDQLRISCYSGRLGNTQKCSNQATTTNETIQSVDFKASHTLGPSEGLTIAVGFPKGNVYEPTQKEKIIDLIKDNWIVILPFIAFGFMWNFWRKHGKDPAGRGTIVPEYEAPEKITPLEMSLLQNQVIQNKAISAHIIYLAEKGFLNITRIEEKKFIGTSVDYALTKMKKITEAENPVDQALLVALYHDDSGDAPANTLKVSDLKNKFFMKLPMVKKAVIHSVITKGYYPADPQITIAKYIGLSLAVVLAAGGVGYFLGASGALFIASLGISFAIMAVFSALMPKVTPAGAVMKERILGLKNYIEVAEEARIKFHNAPEKNPQLFEKLLPYAMVLGVEKAWAKHFESIYMEPPQWYHGTMTGHAFNAVILTDSLSSFTTTAAATFSTAPGSHSGSGGGGFSGGGGGGGGGGSW